MHQFTKDQVKNIWIQAQKLNQEKPFGVAANAVAEAVAYLGYVQIDTINVIERCHHHILYNRIPNYHPKHIKQVQSIDKSVFEYWTHALAYVSTKDFSYFIRSMKNTSLLTGSWLSSVRDDDYKKVKALVRKQGPISIRDIKDDVLVEKAHAWGSSKPSKKALQLGFYKGEFVISERDGMLKKYDLTSRHFSWDKWPKAATETEYIEYILQRALRTQGIISLESATHLYSQSRRVVVAKAIEKMLKETELVEVQIKGLEKIKFYAKPVTLDLKFSENQRTHILSPFDPLIIQRPRLKMLFDYQHLFEAYIPLEKRKFGYFALPVLHKNNIIAVLDLKTDRAKNKVLIQNWVWLDKYKSKANKTTIEMELERFTRFQLQK
jgi:uncharacterized protein YcaQ